MRPTPEVAAPTGSTPTPTPTLPDPGPQAPVARGPGRPRSEEAERAILDAALDLLASHGVAGFTMEAVAGRAGVAKTTVYRRWSNKYDLLFDAVVQLKGPVLAPPGGSIRGDLVFLLTAMRDRTGDPRHSRIMGKLCAEVRDHAELFDAYWERTIRPRRAVFDTVLQRGIDAGELRPDLPFGIAVEALCAPVLTHVVMRPSSLSDEKIHQLVDIVLAGLAPRDA